MPEKSADSHSLLSKLCLQLQPPSECYTAQFRCVLHIWVSDCAFGSSREEKETQQICAWKSGLSEGATCCYFRPLNNVTLMLLNFCSSCASELAVCCKSSLWSFNLLRDLSSLIPCSMVAFPTEAAFTLLLYCELLQWEDRPLREFLHYPSQSEWQRKEGLCRKIIHYFNKGKVCQLLLSSSSFLPFSWLRACKAIISVQ